MTAVLSERVELAKHVVLSTGKHHAPDAPDACPTGWCVMEKFAWITGYDRWTDDPGNCSRVIGAFCRRYNDWTDQAGRDELDRWMLANVDRLVATAGDGLDEKRGYLAANFAVHTVLPAWLTTLGMTDAAAQIATYPQIVDRESALKVRTLNAPLRDQLWSMRAERWQALRGRVRAAVLEAMKNAAAADAAATATADATALPSWSAVYNAVYKKVRPIYDAAIREKHGPVIEEFKAGALDLLEQMVAIGEEV